MPPIEIARPSVPRRIVGVVRLRKIVAAAAVVRVVVLALRQRVVVLRVDAVPVALPVRELQRVVPRFAVVGHLDDVL